MNRTEIGPRGEHLAAAYLEWSGCEILARNVRVADVELDIVARDADWLVVAEVKVRTSQRETAADALRPAQRRRLGRAARALLARSAWAEGVRIDVVGIDVRDGEVRLQHWRGIAADD